jgi:hypothetical protein
MPDEEQLPPLGVALEKGRIASGQATEPFLRHHRLSSGVWSRLKYGRLTPNGGRPRDATIIRYAAAAGVDKQTALALAERTFATPKRRRMSRLGAALEEIRRSSGEATAPFLAARGLASTTWYRLLYDLDVAPDLETVVEYARKVGLPTKRALALAHEDSRSRHVPVVEYTEPDTP